MAVVPSCFKSLAATRFRSWRVHRAKHMQADLGNPVLQAGTVDTLIDQLPGFPDGVSRADDGSFWVGRVNFLTIITINLKHLYFQFIFSIKIIF